MHLGDCLENCGSPIWPAGCFIGSVVLWGDWLPPRISTPTKELAKEILSYFLRNPQAADSLEGVTRWRLLEERIHRHVQSTYEALHWLVEEGYLVQESSEWTDAVYRLNKESRGKAERFMGQAKSRAKSPHG
jgi:hypothetical protein